MDKCLKTGRSVLMEDLKFNRPDGKDGFLEIRLSPISYDWGVTPGILLMGAEITERKLLESQLIQAQKLESIGQLAAGIAHEINTPTQYVGDNARFLKDAFTDFMEVMRGFETLMKAAREGTISESLIEEIEKRTADADLAYLFEEVPKAISQSLDGVARISKIVRSMKEFSHPGMDIKTPMDINKALESTLTVARNEWKYVADVETDFDPDLLPMPCYPGELNQVFLNIIINAAHAIQSVYQGGESGKKGLIKVATRNLADKVEIRFSDTGPGIPKEIRHRIFDPFFTTKEVGKGTGQGLAIAHRVILEKHGGSLRFETKMARGTVFIIELPLSDAG
jgi:signal transduction histidine kinase